MKTRKHLLAGALLVAAGIATGCDAALLDLDAGTGTLEVLVRRGPINPVQREGELNDAPVHGARVAARPSSGGVVRHTSTDVMGFARFRVPAGRWTVVVEACPGAMHIPIAQTVDVQAGGFGGIRFDCDTGIR